jgi:hypothetical protein
MCHWCRRFEPDSWSCAAFPGGVPGALDLGGADHRAPLPGDGGLRFEPRNRDAARAVEAGWGVEPVRYVGALNPENPAAPTAALLAEGERA